MPKVSKQPTTSASCKLIYTPNVNQALSITHSPTPTSQKLIETIQHSSSTQYAMDSKGYEVDNPLKTAPSSLSNCPPQKDPTNKETPNKPVNQEAGLKVPIAAL